MTETSKICCVCKQSKSLSEFSICRSRKDGLQPRCKICSGLASEASRSKHYSRHIHHGHKPSARNGFAINPITAPTLHPTTKDICWAAGIYEGEGSVYKNPQCGKYRGLKITVPQKDPWILLRLRNLFGGAITHLKNRTVSLWRISGDRALGFSMTIYCLLSPWRREQLKRVWA